MCLLAGAQSRMIFSLSPLCFLVASTSPLPAQPPTLRATLEGHGARVAVALSGDGKLLATGGLTRKADDTVVILWDVATAKEKAVLKGLTDDVYSLAFSRDDKLLAAATGGGTVRVWEAAAGKPKVTLKHPDNANVLIFGTDSKTLYTGSGDGSVRVWDVESGKTTSALDGRVGAINALALSRDGTWLAWGGQDGLVRVWDIAGAKEKGTFKHDNWVSSVAFSSDGKWLVVGGLDPTVRVWDMTTGKEKTAVKATTHNVFAVAFSPDGKLLAVGSENIVVRLWEVETGKEQALLKRAGPPLAFSKDAKLLVTGSGGGGVIGLGEAKLWEVPGFKVIDK